MRRFVLPCLALLACTSNEPTDSETESPIDTSPTVAATSAFSDRAVDLLGELETVGEQFRTRAVGTAGYDASVAFVEDHLRSLGLEPEQHTFNHFRWSEDGSPELSGPDSGELVLHFQYSAGGTATGTIVPVDVVLPPGAENSSTSGCEASDFANFPSGGIALMQRGTCTFATKAALAEQAGAVAALIFNEGQAGREATISGSLSPSDPPGIPVLGLSFEHGTQLATYTDPVTVTARATQTLIPSVNVLVTFPGTQPGRVVVGGHLDSVEAGHGSNDNGSGSALLLAMAEELANLRPAYGVTLAWWGAEEVGLVGSAAWVRDGLASGEIQDVVANLNFDMVASPNGARFIYDGDGSGFGGAGPTGSGAIEKVFEDHFAGLGLETIETAFDGRSDYGPFIAVGIPAGGLFSGAEMFNRNGSQYDACYHRACDLFSGVNQQLFRELSDGAWAATRAIAVDGNFAPAARARGLGSLNTLELEGGCGNHDLRR